MSASEFYDNFIGYQVKSGINDRIYGLYRRVLKSGISRKSRLLEIGCGIGTLTSLLRPKIPDGIIEAIDISPRSVGYARERLQGKNLRIETADLLEFHPKTPSFDRILLFDVLEHLPENQLQAVFQKIAGWMQSDSELLINLPNPAFTLYDRINDPSGLQETDNAVFLKDLAPMLDRASLEIRQFETYSVWVEEDYQFYVVKRQKEFVRSELRSKRSLAEKVLLRLKRNLRKWRYHYP